MNRALRALAGRVWLLVSLFVIAAAAVAGGLLVAGGGSGPKTAASACPAGQRIIAAGEESPSAVLIGGKVKAGDKAGERDRGKARGEAGDYESHFRGRCAPVTHPESSKDLAKFNEYASTRQGSDSPQAFSKALRQRDKLAHQAAAANVPGTGGSWTPYGKGPLIGDDPTYPTTLGDGFGKIGGRINDFVYVDSTKKLYAAVAQGGVWESSNLGDSWTSIGDNLPIQSTGAIGYTTAGGGTLIVSTGDHAFSNDYAGVGTYWSTDDGAHWHKAKGAPVGALSFRVFVDPTDAKVVYLATGFGLYRSSDAGRSFANVKLPTGDCAGDSSKPNCFFANVVTDVAVQATDKLGHKGGAVIAAVGWRAGQFPNFNGKPQAPANGVYRSDNGAVGSFTKIPDSAGFTATDHAARTEFGTSTGPDQNSNYLYAVAQDAKLFVEQSGGENDIPLVGTPSVLDAIYVSPDFGKTWKVMESRNEFFNPANGSALSQLTALGIGPGYQVTYNEWIKPDPTRTAPDGTPARVLLGMEEVWQTNSTKLLPQNGHSQFQVFGAYTANGGACLAVPEQCGTKQAIAGNTTTHPDQHGSALIPDGKGGVTLVVGNDGGAYKQHADSGQEFTQIRWGDGANNGFNTLLPYGAAMAKDGTVYGGLQDNGELKILPSGEQHTVYVGDGTFALVDPNNSQIAYDELPNAGINVSTDGGSTWKSIDPSLSDPDFVAPMVMDPGNAKHILAAGRDIAETTAGPDTTTCKTDPSDPTSCQPPQSATDWKYVFNLGTMKHPGDPNAAASSDPAKADGTNADDAPNHASAAALVGDNAYIGFCGDCDPVKRHRVFHNGFATNVGGSKPPKAATGDGWHIAAAKGLPNRIITGVVPDPKNPKTVYVTLGASASRYFAPLGSLGENASSAAGGHVYKSTDAGATFKNISGNLPNVQASWPLVRNGQLIVATAIGVYASRGTSGGTDSPLGDTLPNVAVYQISLKPGDPNTLVASTYGRGVYTYKFANRSGGCSDRIAPRTRFAAKAVSAARRGRGSRKLRLSGKVTDRGCGGKKGKVKRVLISVARQSVHTGNGGLKCRDLKANGRFAPLRSCHRFLYIKASFRGTTWHFTSKRKVPAGSYR
ncbi:MAG: hypothetical protein QOC77_3859, partial [Thermoleophilaceae bacterium]|nr:hypothetical protein [Thermoleophilaceae bacterium]